MPFIQIFNFEGTKIGEKEVNDFIFGIEPHMAAVHRVVIAHLANCRQGTVNTKNRGDVSGGGKKPWRQKHTGRARQGSTRSPVWTHGGVAHGPHPRDYHMKVNKKVRQLAMRSVLSNRVSAQALSIVQGLDTLQKPSTKSVSPLLEKFNAKKTLFVYHTNSNGVNLVKSVRNIKGSKCINVDSLNVYDILNADNVLLSEQALSKIEEVYSK